MAERVFFGQYKKDGRLVSYNILWYKVVCIALDYLFIISVEGEKEIVEKKSLLDYINKQDLTKEPDLDAKINRALRDMGYMGLISYNPDSVVLHEEGKKAYIDRRFHNILATLMESAKTRRLSRVAVYIAIASFISALVSTLVSTYFSICH